MLSDRINSQVVGRLGFRVNVWLAVLPRFGHKVPDGFQDDRLRTLGAIRLARFMQESQIFLEERFILRDTVERSAYLGQSRIEVKQLRFIDAQVVKIVESPSEQLVSQAQGCAVPCYAT